MGASPVAVTRRSGGDAAIAHQGPADVFAHLDDDLMAMDRMR